jgi:hypothetical protein
LFIFLISYFNIFFHKIWNILVLKLNKNFLKISTTLSIMPWKISFCFLQYFVYFIVKSAYVVSVDYAQVYIWNWKKQQIKIIKFLNFKGYRPILDAMKSFSKDENPIDIEDLDSLKCLILETFAHQSPNKFNHI